MSDAFIPPPPIGASILATAPLNSAARKPLNGFSASMASGSIFTSFSRPADQPTAALSAPLERNVDSHLPWIKPPVHPMAPLVVASSAGLESRYHDTPAAFAQPLQSSASSRTAPATFSPATTAQPSVYQSLNHAPASTQRLDRLPEVSPERAMTWDTPDSDLSLAIADIINATVGLPAGMSHGGAAMKAK